MKLSALKSFHTTKNWEVKKRNLNYYINSKRNFKLGNR